MISMPETEQRSKWWKKWQKIYFCLSLKIFQNFLYNPLFFIIVFWCPFHFPILGKKIDEKSVFLYFTQNLIYILAWWFSNCTICTTLKKSEKRKVIWASEDTNFFWENKFSFKIFEFSLRICSFWITSKWAHALTG